MIPSTRFLPSSMLRFAIFAFCSCICYDAVTFENAQAVDQRLTQDPTPLTGQEILDLYPWMQQLSTGGARRLQAELSLRNIQTIKQFDKNSGRVALWGLILNLALLVLTISTVWVSIKSYRDADRSSQQQQATLEASRTALQQALTTAGEQQRLLQQSVDVSTKQLAIITQQQQREMQQPDVHAVLLYPQRPSILLTNTSRGKTAHDASHEARFWNLSHLTGEHFVLDSSRHQKCDYIYSNSACGPYEFDFAINKPAEGDELFGYVTVQCPDCATYRVYWAYIIYGKDGVFTEGKMSDYDWYHMTPQDAKEILEQFKGRKGLMSIPTKWP